MDRPITGFHLDEEQDWVAELACGHAQHVRHRPPFFNRPWTLTEAGRASRIGSSLACPLCDRLQFPEGLSSVHRTPVFDNETIPDKLLSDHSTKAGVWAMIRVLTGALLYTVKAPVSKTFLLDEKTPGVVAPEIKHYIEPVGHVQFYVELYRKA